MRWQRVAQAVIAIFVIAFVALLVTKLRRGGPAPASAPTVREDPTAPLENPGGGTSRYSDPSGKQRWVLEFGTHVARLDERQQFRKGVKATINRADRQFVINSAEADIVPSGDGVKEAVFRGDVRLKGSDGLEVSGAEATYTQADDTIRIPGRVEFSKGRLKGSGSNATYDQAREVFWMRQDARVDVAAAADGTGALEATAGAIGLARADHYIRLEGNGRIVGDGRDAQASDITIRLTDDDARVRALELRGNSRITGASGSAQSMTARDIDMLYAEDGRTLVGTKLVDNAVVQLPGTSAATGKRIAGNTIDMTLGPDGSTVTGLAANERVQVDLPAEGDVPAKRILSATLTASGAGGGGLQNATFGSGVVYNETRAARRNLAAISRTARSQTLTVETAPGLGAIQKADFRGNVQFEEPPNFRADAQQGIYDIARDRLDLMSLQGQPGPASPTVTDGGVTVAARTIQFSLTSREMTADTKVRSTIQPRRGGRGRGNGESKLPSMLAQDEPVSVTANRLTYKGTGSSAVYTGNAILWQKETTVKAPTISIDETSGNLAGSGGATTSYMVDDTDRKTGTKKRQLTTGSAETFTYDDAKRLATYTGKAHINGPQGDVLGEKIELFLKPQVSELERVEAYGPNGVVQVREGKRIAKGSHLTYTAVDDKYRMIGTPVEIVEEKNGTCTRTLGSTVTFDRASERGEVQGAGSGQLQTRMETLKACPAELIR